MTKTELNTILNVAGYKNIRRGNNAIARGRDGKMIKGFPLCKTSPLDISERTSRLFTDLVRELGKSGLVLDGQIECGIASMKIDKFKVILCVMSTPTYLAIDNMDPNYETKYVKVRVERV